MLLETAGMKIFVIVGRKLSRTSPYNYTQSHTSMKCTWIFSSGDFQSIEGVDWFLLAVYIKMWEETETETDGAAGQSSPSIPERSEYSITEMVC